MRASGPRARPAARVLVAVGLIGLVSLGCLASGSGATTAARGRATLSVFAAASLREAMVELGARFAATDEPIDVGFSFDATSTLRARIEQGAPADVLAAADTSSPAQLVARGLADGEPVEFATNGIVLVTPSDDARAIGSARDLAGPGVRIVAATPEVPITGYVSEVLDRLAGSPGYPTDFAAAVAANVVSQEDNARAVLAKVELGEADAGFVYTTDARSSDRVREVPLPSPASAVRARYAAVALLDEGDAAARHAFVAWLAGSEAREVLERHGFRPP